MKNFSDKQRLEEFINTKLTLKEMLKGLLSVEKKMLQQEVDMYRKRKTPLIMTNI